MEPAKRIIVNTVAQYIKVITNTILALYSTRVVLDVLTFSDYGLYALIAGIVGMLGFITNALIVTTQRYMSYYDGESREEYVKQIFTNSLCIHALFGFLICCFLLSIKFLLIGKFLTIDPARIETASIVYDITTIIFFTTIMTSPFKALLISHENIVYISLIEIIDGILKLLLAFSLILFHGDKLIIYTYGLSFVLFLNLIAFISYDVIKYRECTFNFKQYPINKKCMKQLLGFTGWTTYGMLAGVIRNQGSAAIFNHFMGTIVNAAYGIASQVYGTVSFFSSSLLNAMNPQIMKAEGNNNRKLMLELACKESKFSTAMMAIISIPIMVEMPAILDFWLKEVPSNTVLFCRSILLAFLFDQITLGLHSANQAMGNIKKYTILMFTPKILYLPIITLLLYKGASLTTIMIIYVAIECAVAIMRIPFLKFTAGLKMSHYFRTAILPIIPLSITSLICAITCKAFFNFSFSFFATLIISGLCSMLVAWFFTLDSREREYVISNIQKTKKTHAAI
jgi:O-antigen/teichoic acid export membrane protein